MPWPKQHRQQTRQRIVETAAAAFRVHGIEGVRVDEVMARAGLTHGGFYSHFRSKEALAREVIDFASAQTVEALAKASKGASDETRLHAAIDAYLSPEHAAHPDRGCPVAAIGPEIIRAGGPLRQRLALRIRERLEWMRRLVPR